MGRSKNKYTTGIIVSLIVGIVLFMLLFYLAMPVLSFSFAGIWFVLIFTTFVIAVVFYLFKVKWLYIVPILLLIVFVVFSISSSAIFKAQEKRSLIGEIKTKEFSNEISPVDLTKIPVVDESLAKNLGDKKLGEQVALGSQVTLPDFTLINVNDELFWVAPLVHSGFFKYLDNKEGTPGYIKISASNPQNIKLVQEIDGNKIMIKYQPQAYWGDDLKRHVYMSGHKKEGLTDYSFELDDSGKPYWVITKYENKIGISGSDAIGVVVVNAQTGEINDYDIGNIPNWVDRVIPVNFAIDQINDWGKYVNGWWNPSSKDVLQTSEGVNFVYNNGRCYYYTGLTSAGADESSVGFVLIDSKSKDVSFYRVSGSTEYAARGSAEGKVQNLEYFATFPILVNIENEPTYFMTLKDKQGLVKLYSMVNVKDYSIVGTGETLSKTRSNYMKYLRNTDNLNGLVKSGDLKEITGKVKRISYAVVEDTTYYYIIFENKDDKIFIASLNLSNELPLTREGDNVSVGFLENPNSSIDLVKFDNLEFVQSDS